jgi:hypothetical protein
MLGGISLTLARGVETDEFLLDLGADLDELAARTPCRELRAPAGQPGRPSPQLNRAMYGTCGEWTYVLEDWGMATWATGYQGKVESMLCPAAGGGIPRRGPKISQARRSSRRHPGFRRRLVPSAHSLP